MRMLLGVTSTATILRISAILLSSAAILTLGCEKQPDPMCVLWDSAPGALCNCTWNRHSNGFFAQGIFHIQNDHSIRIPDCISKTARCNCQAANA